MEPIQKKSKKSRVPPQGESRAPARAPAWSHSGSGRRRDSHGQKPPTRGDPGSRIFFHFFDFFDFFRFLAFSKKIKKYQKKKKSRVPPQGESRAPARAPAWSHSGSGRGGIPTARNPPRGETQGPRIFFIFLIFFRFFGLFEKKSKNIKKK